eukprot:m.148430 g.148430  ORF g.148430 m.148430 type:complete len:853 (+) comp15055_c24_seq4:145-2703(+)
MKTAEEVLGELTLALNLDAASRQDCADLWKTLAAALPPPQSDNSLRRVLASCLYFSLRSPDRKNAVGVPFITVSHLLAAAGTDLVTFSSNLKEMKSLLESLPSVAHVAAATAPALTALTLKYCLTSGFWVRYNQLFTSHFGSDPDGKQHGNTLPYLHELGWMAFLVARNAAFPPTQSHPPPLVSLHAAIIAVLARIAEHARTKLNLDPARFTLAVLCQQDAADLEEASRLDQQFIATLFRAPDLHALHREYATQYLLAGDFDEKLFLASDPQLVPAPAAAAATAAPVHVFGGTPIRAAIKTLDKLRESLAARTTTPSPSLAAIFADCHVAPGSVCEGAIAAAREPFLTEYARRFGPDGTATRRLDDALRLFYRYLEMIAVAERARLQRKDLSVILSNATFLRALLCCALDIILFVYTSAQVGREENLEWLLNVVGVSAFDFLKVLETVVRSENCLTESLASHARALEDHIVLTLAWTDGSPLWHALKHTSLQCVLPTQRVAFPSPARGPGASPYVSPYVSPAPATDGTICAAEAGPAETNQAAVRAVAFFSRKLMRVVQTNLRRLAQRLKLPADATSLTLSAVQHALTDHPALVKGLHVDYVIMSCVYSVCKLLDHACPFKSIVYEYRHLDLSSPALCRGIALPSGPGDIIAYYNEVFLPKMKSFIFDLVQSRQGRQVGARPAAHAVMTPHTAMLHCSLESPFRVSSLSTALMSSPAQRKRLFDSDGEGQSGIRHRLSMLRRAASAPTPAPTPTPTPAPALALALSPSPHMSALAAVAAAPAASAPASVAPAPGPTTTIESERMHVSAPSSLCSDLRVSPSSLDAAHALTLVAAEDPASSLDSILNSSQDTL